MFSLLKLFKASKKTTYSPESLEAATQEFDELMVAVEEDQEKLIHLERHIHQEFEDLEEEVKEDCEGVTEALDSR